MDMCPPTDAELNGPDALPQTILTSDLDWEPSSVDYKHDPEVWFDAMEDLPDLDYDFPFDEHEEYLHMHERIATYFEIEQTHDMENTYLSNLHDVIESTSQAR